MKDIVLLLRPNQWLKNLFVFLPLFFGRYLTDIAYWVPSVIAFFSYCFIASAIYCFNDIWDVEADKLHPKKCHRPIASGKISKREAYFLAILCIAISLGIASILLCNGNSSLLWIILFYLFLNVAYCVKLKQIALVDVFIIAIGFVLRLFAGGLSTGIWLSQWIILMTFLLSLFLAFAKRRDDVVIYEETGTKMRKNVNRYNLSFMNQAISIISSITVVCYIMYTVSEDVVSRMHTSYLYLTSIFVLAGIMRYLQITIVDVKSGSPTKVLMHDRFIQLCIVAWIIFFVTIIYF